MLRLTDRPPRDPNPAAASRSRPALDTAWRSAITTRSSTCRAPRPRRHQEGVPTPRHEVPPGPQPGRPRGGGQVQGGEGGLRSPLRRAEARRLRPVRACGRGRHARRRRRGGLRSARRVRRHLRRRLRRHLRRRPARPLAGLPRRRPALRARARPRAGRVRRHRQHRIHDAGRMRGVQGQRRGQGLEAGDLRDLPRRRPGAHAAGLLHRAADLPALPRPRPGRERSLRRVPRPGPHAQAEDAVGQGAGGRGHRRPHPPVGRGRGRAQRRPDRRPLRRGSRARAPDLRARRQPPVLRGAGELRTRRARRQRRGADARRHGDHQGAAGDPVGTRVPPAREGHQARARRPDRRPVLPGGRRDAGQPDRASRRTSCSSSRSRCSEDARRHHPREESWLDGVKRFFKSLGE